MVEYWSTVGDRYTDVRWQLQIDRALMLHKFGVWHSDSWESSNGDAALMVDAC